MEDMKETQEEVPQEAARGPRGEVGTATTQLTIKQRWHQAHFTREDTSNDAHPHRKTWKPSKGAPSLKVFATKLAAEGEQVAKDWLAHKHGSLNQKRSETNVARVALERAATKAAKHKSKK
jgi:hypothetical protein